MYHELGRRLGVRLGLAPRGENHGNGDGRRPAAQSTGKGHGQPTTVGLDDEKLGSYERDLLARHRRRGTADDPAAVRDAQPFQEFTAPRPHIHERNDRRGRRSPGGP